MRFGAASIALAVLLHSPVTGRAEDPATPGWQQGARLFFNEAAHFFAKAMGRSDAANREVTLGRAVMLLGVQPRTEANLNEARRLLSGLLEIAEEDEAAITARYYLARLAQIHSDKPDLAEAREHYRELAERHPRHLFGQQARLKLAMLALYDTSNRAPLAERFPVAAEWGRGITDPVVKCDFHNLMAGALARAEGREEERLEHLLAMEATGQAIRTATRGQLLVELGEMARVVGRRDHAIRAYRQFILEFPRDPRVATIRGRLAALEANP